MKVSFDGKNYIDKLKFVVGVSNYDFGDGNDRSEIIKIFRDNEMVEGIEFYEKWEFGEYIYHLNTKNGRISLHKKGHRVMIEINPQKYDINDKSHSIIDRILQRAKPLHIQKKRLTLKCINILRIDIKQDHLQNLGEYEPVTTLRKNVEFSTLGITETIYIGSRTSDYMYRVYDKAKEMKIDSPVPMWRIEVEIKNKQDIFGWLVCNSRFKPFEKIQLKKRHIITYTEIDQLDTTNSIKCALYTHLNANIKLKNLVGKNQVGKINKLKRDLKYRGEFFKVNEDLREIKIALTELVFNNSLDRLLGVEECK